MRSIVTPRTVSTTAQQIGKQLAAEERRDAREQAVQERPAQTTPGPWAVEGDGAHVASLSHTYEITAPLVGRMVRPDYDQIMADARLIAACPDILAALREMVSIYEGMQPGSFWSQQTRDKVERARATLAKAEGK